MGALQQLPVVILLCTSRGHMRLYARVFKRACVYKCLCVLLMTASAVVCECT